MAQTLHFAFYFSLICLTLKLSQHRELIALDSAAVGLPPTPPQCHIWGGYKHQTHSSIHTESSEIQVILYMVEQWRNPSGSFVWLDLCSSAFIFERIFYFYPSLGLHTISYLYLWKRVAPLPLLILFAIGFKCHFHPCQPPAPPMCPGMCPWALSPAKAWGTSPQFSSLTSMLERWPCWLPPSLALIFHCFPPSHFLSLLFQQLSVSLDIPLRLPSWVWQVFFFLNIF